MSDILIARRTGTVMVDGRRRTVRRGETTAHADAPITRAYPHLWEPLKVDYPAQAVAPASPPAPVETVTEPTDGDAQPPEMETPPAKPRRTRAKAAVEPADG